jgi:hypothetical protein
VRVFGFEILSRVLVSIKRGFADPAELADSIDSDGSFVNGGSGELDYGVFRDS